MHGRTSPALEIRNLRVELTRGDVVVHPLSLAVQRGEILGLVGESGCGKTTTALALLGYAKPGACIVDGEILVDGASVPLNREPDARAIRGRRVSYVPQDPGTALNPALRIGDAIRDMLHVHAPARERDVLPSLDRVGLSATPEFARRFPHQLSGGQQQRVSIAIALACEPPVVVLDEPTTGLDVVTQRRIIDEIIRLRREHELTMVYVTHDLAVVAELADQIAVMYAGRIAEQGPTATVLRHPRHPYTRGLVQSIPDHAQPRRLHAMPGVTIGIDEALTGCPFAPRCPQRTDACQPAVPELSSTPGGVRVRCIHWQQTPPLLIEPPTAHGLRGKPQAPLLKVRGLRAVHESGRQHVVAAERLALDVDRGECVALVGESGSGKTTIARAIAGLHPPSAGEITLDGTPLVARARHRRGEQRRHVQIVFQNPADALSPHRPVGEQITRPAMKLRGLGAKHAREEAVRLLERVRLPNRIANVFPRELSGGERQRVGIARALAADPKLMICDEITSALDVSVQAAVLELLAELRRDLELSMLFITHDLGVVAAIADRVLVLERGAIVEQGRVDDVLQRPKHAYTKRLLGAAPSLTLGAGGPLPG